MGLIPSKILEGVFGDKRWRILMVGLDGAGKTTIMNKLHLGADCSITTPTPGFNVKNYIYKNLAFAVWNAGEVQYHIHWEPFFPETTGIVFVIDCTDRQRAAKAREELHYLLDKIPGIPFIVLANKTDIDSKDWMGAAQITDILGLHSFRYRRWNILSTSAINNKGIEEGLEWLFSRMSTVEEQNAINNQPGFQPVG